MDDTIEEVIERIGTHLTTIFKSYYDQKQGLTDALLLAEYLNQDKKWFFRKEITGYFSGDSNTIHFPHYRSVDVVQEISSTPAFDYSRKTVLLNDSCAELIRLKEEAQKNDDRVVKHLFGTSSYFIELKTIDMVINHIKADTQHFFLEVAKSIEMNLEYNPRYEDDLIAIIQNKKILKRLEEAWRCYRYSCYEGASILLRKVLEMSLHIILKISEKKDDALYDHSGGKRIPYKLTRKLDIIQGKGVLSLYLADQVKLQTKFFGDLSAHDFNISITKEEFLNANIALKKALEHMFTIGKSP